MKSGVLSLSLKNHARLFRFFFLRKLFFSDYGSVAKLERCSLDGSERSRIVESGMEQPTALTLDLIRKLVYWADTYLDVIEVVDYDGNHRHTIIRRNPVSPITGRNKTRAKDFQSDLKFQKHSWNVFSHNSVRESLFKSLQDQIH